MLLFKVIIFLTVYHMRKLKCCFLLSDTILENSNMESSGVFKFSIEKTKQKQED